MSVLKLYGFIPRKHTASWYYRIQLLFETARDLGLPVQCRIDTDDAGISPQQHIEGFAGSDVTLLYQPLGEEAIKQVQAAKTILPSKMEDGAWKHPPAIVIDSDDNLFNVNPHNAAFRTLGIRDPNGNDLEPGMLVGSMEDDGTRKTLWQDGQDGFDIRRNLNNLKSYRALIEMADAFTTTSPHIVQAVEKECIPARTKIWPNLVRLDHYEQLDLVPDPSVIKILWQGGGSHGEDFFPLRKAFGALTKKYPQIHWIIWGAMYHWALEEIPPDRFTHVRWCPYHEYRLRRVMFGEDISIAPLTDNPFNRCRSAIKWYEASVLKRPAATVAQATGPYKDEILNGQTGLLFDTPDEFEAQVSRVVEDVPFRKTLGANAKDWVNENRNAWKEVPKWVRWLEQLREETIRETPHMPDSKWDAFVESQMESEAGV